MKFIQEDKKIGRWTIGYLSLEDGSFLIRERCDNLQDAIKMLHDLKENNNGSFIKSVYLWLRPSSS